MSIRDYDSVFDQIDISCQGYLTVNQLHDFHKSLYFSSIPLSQINSTVKQICGVSSAGKVSRELFIIVLLEIERQRTLQEQCYWDFRALDTNGDGKIMLRDAFILFQEFHGEKFSLDTWKRFLSCREYPNCDVYYDEIKSWLSEIPDGPPCTDQEISAEEKRLKELTEESKWQEYVSWNSFQEDNAYDEDYRNDINREAQRKLNKWTRQGVEAMLYDDGLDLAMNVGNQPLKPRNSINMSDLMDALDQKYNILQDRLLLHMAEVSSNMESEVTEIFQSLRKHTKQLLKDKNLSDNSSDLPGANAVLPYTLAAVMGHHKSDKNFELMEANILKLKKEGKTEKEINEFYENQFEDLNNGSKTCGDILVQLNERHEQERDYCLSILHSGQDRKTTTNLLNTELASLSHQHSLLGYESAINQSAFSLGLGERGAKDELQGLDAIRWRKLAQLRLEDKKGRKQTRVTDNKLTLIKTDDLGTIDLRLKVIEEIDRKHFFEREALINMLEGPESNQWLAEVRNLPTMEQDSRITKYRNQQKNWMNNLSSVQPDPQTLNNHQNILHQAVAIHWCHIQVTMEISQPNIADDQISAAILSELQKFQETEIKDKIEEIQSLGVKELKKLIKTEYCLCINECFEGIASITLGSLKVSDEEKEYLDAVDEKYSAIRDKLFLYLLQQQHGLNWINLPVDVKQKEIVRMRREEKKIRSTGQTDDFIQFLGTKGMALPSLNSLLGPQKWRNADNVVNNSSTDILSDLIGRYDAEQQGLLNWLQRSEVKNYPNRKKRKEIVYARLQTRTISLDTDLEAAYIATGLLERLEDRDKEDKTRVTRLGELNVKLWRDRKEEGKRYKKLYPDYQKQKQGDITDSQLHCLMEVKHRHGDEREQLLQLVNEVSSEDLQEAAAMMGEGDRQKRLSELQTKYQSLDLTNADDINEYRSIVEEAGAIQVICRKATLQKERKRGVTPDMTAASLLENLYRQQDKDLRSLYVKIDKMEEEELRALQLKEREKRKKDISMNVMKVLTMVEGAAHEHDILQIIDRKYDVLKDRVLLESIKQSHDTSAWSKINSHDKQKLVDRLKESTEKSWRQGNIEEFAASIGLEFKLSFDLKNVLGADRESFNKTGKIAVFQEEFTENGVLCLDVIKFLWNRFETEKEYIINMSRGASGSFISDNEKFVLISRLTREMTVCNYESSLYLSGLLVGLLERQVNDVQNLSDLDLPRYKVLAAETITWCKSKKDDIKITNGLKSTDKITLQNNVLLLLHNQHLQERLDWFKMLTNTKQAEISKMASVKSQQQRNDCLIALKNTHATLNPVAVDETLNILLEAMVYKLENLKSLSEYENYTEEMILVLMMAFLVQHQLVQAEKILQHFPEQSSEDLTWLANQLTSDQHNKRCNNVATIVFSTYAIRESTEDELLTALEGKYDALRDKLIVEALINQYGELDWSKITDEERQKKILELKIKERRLRRDGKLGDVNKLIGESLKNQDALAKLMGHNQAEQERKLKERLERRKQRKAQGRTEEECDNMEEEDRKKEEEEEKKNTNIILELENRFDQVCLNHIL
ncbi:putative autophagy-related protein 11 [Patella vulgata]|uniref:putative autophagy-related protein 11 n=1 Tax=Patella vulgata TaxID=6465 RepID=UPI0024A9A6FD|nr:putative autophagy-related protein 11 [Patella vulgata]